jgi:tripartite-type tricarboxylate transporter receptor subunit TctC
LVICIDAGLSFESAFDRVRGEIFKQSQELGTNLEMMGAEMRAGRSTLQALEAFADRLGFDEATSFNTMLRQSMELGSDIGEALRIFGQAFGQNNPAARTVHFSGRAACRHASCCHQAPNGLALSTQQLPEFRGFCPCVPKTKHLHVRRNREEIPWTAAQDGSAIAQAYPTRPVRIIAATAAGSAPDIVALLMGSWLSERLSQSFVVENRPGGGGNIGTEAVVRAPVDGHTLLLADATAAINATLYEKLNFVFLRDIAPVASSSRDPAVMRANPSLPAKTVPEFLAYSKANPGKINFASGGSGSRSHLTGEMFRMMTGVTIVHVPYRGTAPALTVVFDAIPSSIEHIRVGRLRPLAMTTATRSEALPGVPTVAEFVPGYEASAWNGVGAPKGTPVEVINKLNK